MDWERSTLYYVNDISKQIKAARLEGATPLNGRAGWGKRWRQAEKGIAVNSKFYITAKM